MVLEYGSDAYAGFCKLFAKMPGSSARKHLGIYQEYRPTRPEAVDIYTKQALREILQNWNIDRDLPISDIRIATVQEFTKVSGQWARITS